MTTIKLDNSILHAELHSKAQFKFNSWIFYALNITHLKSLQQIKKEDSAVICKAHTPCTFSLPQCEMPNPAGSWDGIESSVEKDGVDALMELMGVWNGRNGDCTLPER
jgi:hypothetical protein